MRAAAEHDWQSVRRQLSELCDLDAEMLELGARAAWWLGDLPVCIEMREKAFACREAARDGVGAARLAMLLSDNNHFLGHTAVANGWLRRARRLLAEQPACLEHGYLALREAEWLHGVGRLEHAASLFGEAIACAKQFADADLEADGLQGLGRVLISMGQPTEGLAHLDEAMLSAARGELSPYTTGKVYCSLMSACEELGDMARVIEWSEEATRWATAHGEAIFPGLCRVHRAEVLCHRGEFREAEIEAARACDELVEVHRPNAAAAYQTLGEIRRRLDDQVGAEAAFARAIELGGDAQPGLALLRLRQGRLVAAAAMIDRGLWERAQNPLRRAKLLPAQVEILLAAGEKDAAAAAADELANLANTYPGAQLRADALAATGRVRLAAGEWVLAGIVLRDALEQYRLAGSPYHEAVTQTLLTQAYHGMGDTAAAQAVLAAASETFQLLGAGTEVSIAFPPANGLPPAKHGDLTERERQVLRLVVAGMTNRQIATRLVISEKTVARHLANIFTKTGVSSRSAAVAYAYETGLVHTAGSPWVDTPQISRQ